MIAPWAAPLAVVLFFVVQSRGWSFRSELPWILGVGAITGYVGLFAIGLPIMRALRRAGRLNLLSLTLCAVPAGVLAFYLFLRILGFLLESSAPFELRHAIWGASLGAFVALVFGVIAGLTLRSSGPPSAAAEL
jgi:hypothetical protein